MLSGAYLKFEIIKRLTCLTITGKNFCHLSTSCVAYSDANLLVKILQTSSFGHKVPIIANNTITSFMKVGVSPAREVMRGTKSVVVPENIWCCARTAIARLSIAICSWKKKMRKYDVIQ